MRAGLPQKEPGILEGWADLYPRLRAERQAAGAPLFVLHDGPPYANGAIHIGHALNKTLKDFVVRSRFALGFDVDYVPAGTATACPIEWKIEEQLRKEGRRKGEVPKAEFRRLCREYADHWIGEQSVEFQRLGVLGHWDGRYATMDFPTEAAIVAEFHKVLMSAAVPRLQARDVEPRRAHRPGRRRGRVPPARLAHDLGQVPVVGPGDMGPGACRSSARIAPDAVGRPGTPWAQACDLDHHALDNPRQPRHRLRRRHQLRPLRGRGVETGWSSSPTPVPANA
jgi:hypothetical protein